MPRKLILACARTICSEIRNRSISGFNLCIHINIYVFHMCVLWMVHYMCTLAGCASNVPTGYYVCTTVCALIHILPARAPRRQTISYVQTFLRLLEHRIRADSFRLSQVAPVYECSHCIMLCHVCLSIITTTPARAKNNCV